MENTATPQERLRPTADEPWTAEAWAAARTDSRWADERWAAEMRERFERYPSLHLEEMDILYDVTDTWDHENLVHYPDMPCLEEYLAEIGEKLYAIRWKKP
jgi:hypothetical protein